MGVRNASMPLDLGAAHDLLDAFDLADDPEARTFLADLLASGIVPQEEVDRLCREGGGGGRRRRRSRRRKGRRGCRDGCTNECCGGPPPAAYHKHARLNVEAATTATAAAAADVSPFFAEAEVEAGDGSPSEDAEPEPEPAARTPWSTKTVAIYQRRTVLYGDAGTPTPRETSAVSLSGASSPSPVASPVASPPVLDTPKRRRETTSSFFTPPRRPGAGSGREVLDDDDNDDNDNDDNDRAGPSRRSPALRPRRGTVSALPFPPLTAPCFGLVQEQLAREPFWLLVALVFLVRVAGRVSLPVFWAVRARYPQPADLAAADPRDLVAAMRHLGMASVRCAAVQRYARLWQTRPPQPGVCAPVKNYPLPPPPAPAPPAPGSAWEIGHLTQGAYAIDSWRIFCRDALLGRSADWKGDAERHSSSGGGGGGGDGASAFEPEWMRVLPRDKELRACLRWMWMRAGWDWDPQTGQRTPLGEDLRRAVNEGRVRYDVLGQLQIVEETDTGEAS